ncbi:hypothetical protein AX774_g3026 [Zancudomyces culisetae]|uniref:Uncharacterized protein n=1 Tax=Zancudomyces culisetae TaxID=1213189 RepID=A0A1R1PR69_ZANCU|nr:hypothetical protein AX774_g3026 [Zancudomyces culisetae]|eukprot:OMH83470.1 hypothetical protein AX774_g3026 [Zancudomyces culisetae]
MHWKSLVVSLITLFTCSGAITCGNNAAGWAACASMKSPTNVDTTIWINSNVGTLFKPVPSTASLVWNALLAEESFPAQGIFLVPNNKLFFDSGTNTMWSFTIIQQRLKSDVLSPGYWDKFITSALEAMNQYKTFSLTVNSAVGNLVLTAFPVKY